MSMQQFIQNTIRRIYRENTRQSTVDVENGEFEAAGQVVILERLNIYQHSNPLNHVSAIWRHKKTRAVIYIGDKYAAQDAAYLTSLNIKCIVNCTRPSVTGRGELPNYHEFSTLYKFDYLSFPVDILSKSFVSTSSILICYLLWCSSDCSLESND